MSFYSAFLFSSNTLYVARFNLKSFLAFIKTENKLVAFERTPIRLEEVAVTLIFP